MNKEIKNICLVLPTLNEIDGMKWAMPKIDRSLFKEIIVTDGHSTDGTIEYSKEIGLKVVLQDGIGLPNSYECALRETQCDGFIMFTPDGNSLPELLPEMCKKLKEGYDVVVASRYKDNAKSDDDDPVTAFGNKMFTFITNVLFRCDRTDALVGLRAYRRDAIERMKLVEMLHYNWLRESFFYMSSWEYGATIRSARLKLKVCEIPGDEPKRIGGVRKMSIIKNGIGTVFQMVADFFFFKGE